MTLSLFAKSLEALQSMLSDLELYCRTWGLNIDISKPKSTIFKLKRVVTPVMIFYRNNVKLELVTSFKYLESLLKSHFGVHHIAYI